MFLGGVDGLRMVRGFRVSRLSSLGFWISHGYVSVREALEAKEKAPVGQEIYPGVFLVIPFMCLGWLVSPGCFNYNTGSLFCQGLSNTDERLWFL